MKSRYAFESYFYLSFSIWVSNIMLICMKRWCRVSKMWVESDGTITNYGQSVNAKSLLWSSLKFCSMGFSCCRRTSSKCSRDTGYSVMVIITGMKEQKDIQSKVKHKAFLQICLFFLRFPQKFYEVFHSFIPWENKTVFHWRLIPITGIVE